MSRQEYRPTNNGYLPKTPLGQRGGWAYEENKNLRHLLPSPHAVNVQTNNNQTHYQYVGGQVGYQLMYQIPK